MSVGLARRAVLVTGLPPSCRAAALPNTPGGGGGDPFRTRRTARDGRRLND